MKIPQQDGLARPVQNQNQDRIISMFEPKHPGCWILRVVEPDQVDVGEAAAGWAVSGEHYTLNVLYIASFHIVMKKTNPYLTTFLG